MTERARAAIDVQLLPGNAEVLLRRHGHDRKGLVDLEKVDIADLPADLVEQLPDRRDRRRGEPLWFLAMRRMALDLGENRNAFAIGERTPSENERRGAVGIR